MKSALLVTFCCVVLLAPGCATDQSKNSKWDYVIVSAADPLKMQKVNQLASEGWQLVDTDPAKGFLFKRSKQ